MCLSVQQLPALSIGSVPEKYVSQHVITLKTTLHIASAFEKRLWKYIIGYTLYIWQRIKSYVIKVIITLLCSE